MLIEEGREQPPTHVAGGKATDCESSAGKAAFSQAGPSSVWQGRSRERQGGASVWAGHEAGTGQDAADATSDKQDEREREMVNAWVGVGVCVCV